MTLEEALASRHQLQQEFEAVLSEKVRQIQRHYDNPKLNEKQLMFLKKDEELCKVVEAFANKLIAQINYLIFENNEQKVFMQGLTKDADKWQELYINIAIELNEIRFKQLKEEGKLKFDFDKGINV